MVDKSKLSDAMGRPLTQGLFLELGYKDSAIYTLKDYDHEWEGKKYPSLKKIYLEMEDVTEYDFASQHLMGWKQWQRICENKALAEHVGEWREELEYKLRSRAAKQMIEQAGSGSYQATKWLLDRGWSTRSAGRPSSIEKQSHLAKEERVLNEYSADIVRLRKEA